MTTLLRQIQDAALDSGTSLPDLLRRCKVLAARLKHMDFALWVDRELQGYGLSDELPAYRTINTMSFGNFMGPFGSGMRNALIPPSALPEEFQKMATTNSFRLPVSELAALADGPGSEALRSPWPADAVAIFQQLGIRVYSGDVVLAEAWNIVPKSALTGILDTVRTRILEFVLAIESIEPTAGDPMPGEAPKVSDARVTQVFHTVVNGGVASIGTVRDSTINTRRIEFSSAVRDDQHDELRRLLLELRSTAESSVPDRSDKQQALNAIENIEQLLSKPKPAIDRIEAFLSVYASLVTVAAPTVNALKELLPVALKALEAIP